MTPTPSEPEHDSALDAAKETARRAVTEHHDETTAREAVELELEDAGLSDAGTEVSGDDHPA